MFLHGLVRDGQGRKMSKSLGNVVDPLDVIETQGADALRFTLATGTTPGQDLNLSMERLSGNRNLTNKMWNAGKLILLNLDALGDEERCALADFTVSTDAALRALPLAERRARTHGRAGQACSPPVPRGGVAAAGLLRRTGGNRRRAQVDRVARA